jgi:hypothetical protein
MNWKTCRGPNSVKAILTIWGWNFLRINTASAALFSSYSALQQYLQSTMHLLHLFVAYAPIQPCLYGKLKRLITGVFKSLHHTANDYAYAVCYVNITQRTLQNPSLLTNCVLNYLYWMYSTLLSSTITGKQFQVLYRNCYFVIIL